MIDNFDEKYHEFVEFLRNNSDDIIFIENRLGTNGEHHKVITIPYENLFSKKDWDYRFETIPYEDRRFSGYPFYTRDFYRLILNGFFQMYSRDILQDDEFKKTLNIKRS